MFEILRLLCPSSKYGGIQQKFNTSLGRIYSFIRHGGEPLWMPRLEILNRLQFIFVPPICLFAPSGHAQIIG
jgi:hypothetical protein